MNELTIEEFLKICKDYNSTFTVDDLIEIAYPISYFTKENLESLLNRKWKED